jgi:hypothetical protein
VVLAVALLLLALAAVAVVLVARGISGGTALGTQTERLETRSDAAAVSIENECGQISVREGAAGVVQTEARITRFWSTPTVTSAEQGETVRVDVRCPAFSGTVRLTVEVPAGVDVQARSAAGGVQADGLSGRLDLRSSAGSVQGENLGSDDVEAQSSAGSVTLGWNDDADPQRVDASSSAGSVTVLLPDRPGEAFAVDADSSAGTTRVEVRTDPAATRTVRAESSAGSVTVAYD